MYADDETNLGVLRWTIFKAFEASWGEIEQI